MKDVRILSLGEQLNNISVVESVATILSKSVSRMLGVSEILSGDGKKPVDDGLKSLIQQQVVDLYHSSRTTFRNLELNTNTLSQKNEISQVIKKIMDNLTKTITIKYTDKESYKKRQDKKRKYARQENSRWWEEIGVMFFWYFGRGD